MTEISYKGWSTTVYLRRAYVWSHDNERVPLGINEPVAVIFDPRGWAWHVTLDGSTVSSVTVESLGAPVDESALRTVPLSYLAEVARDAIGTVDELVDGGGSVESALAAASTPRGFVRVQQAPPPPELFAHYWNSLPKKDEEGRTKRWQAAAYWQREVWTIDKWLKEARDLGLIVRPNTTTKKEN